MEIKAREVFQAIKKSFENQSLSNFSTNVLGDIVFVAATYLLSFVNNMNPESANLYPNYLYIYMLHLYAPFCFAGYFGISYYIQHKPFRTVMRREVTEMLKEFT